jgi:hypothetical protein
VLIAARAFSRLIFVGQCREVKTCIAKFSVNVKLVGVRCSNARSSKPLRSGTCI